MKQLAKRVGGLYAALCDPDNLRLAFYKAAKGKRDRKEVIAFQQELEENLHLLRQELLQQTICLGDYRFFTVYEPKKETSVQHPFVSG